MAGQFRAHPLNKSKIIYNLKQDFFLLGWIHFSFDELFFCLASWLKVKCLPRAFELSNWVRPFDGNISRPLITFRKFKRLSHICCSFIAVLAIDIKGLFEIFVDWPNRLRSIKLQALASHTKGIRDIFHFPRVSNLQSKWEPYEDLILMISHN